MFTHGVSDTQPPLFTKHSTKRRFRKDQKTSTESEEDNDSGSEQLWQTVDVSAASVTVARVARRAGATRSTSRRVCAGRQCVTTAVVRQTLRTRQTVKQQTAEVSADLVDVDAAGHGAVVGVAVASVACSVFIRHFEKLETKQRDQQTYRTGKDRKSTSRAS